MGEAPDQEVGADRLRNLEDSFGLVARAAGDEGPCLTRAEVAHRQRRPILSLDLVQNGISSGRAGSAGPLGLSNWNVSSSRANTPRSSASTWVTWRTSPVLM